MANDLEYYESHLVNCGNIVESHQSFGGTESLSKILYSTQSDDPDSLYGHQCNEVIMDKAIEESHINPRVKDGYSFVIDKWSKAVRFGMIQGYD